MRYRFLKALLFLLIAFRKIFCALPEHTTYVSTISDQALLKDRSKLPQCDEDQLMIYLAEIEAINPESIINLTTLEDLDALCTKVSTNLDRMDLFLKQCQPPEQSDLYIQLIKGVDSLYDKVCSESPFKTEFENSFKCLQDLHTDFKDCTGPPDWAEEEDNEKICSAYKSIVDCYYIKSAKLCGLKAAHLFKELTIAVFDSILTNSCSNVKKDPFVADPMPEEASFKKSNGSVTTASPLIITIGFSICNIIYVTCYLQNFCINYLIKKIY